MEIAKKMARKNFSIGALYSITKNGIFAVLLPDLRTLSILLLFINK